MVKKTILSIVFGLLILQNTLDTVIIDRIPPQLKIFIGGGLLLYGLFSKAGGKFEIPIISDLMKK